MSIPVSQKLRSEPPISPVAVAGCGRPIPVYLPALPIRAVLRTSSCMAWSAFNSAWLAFELIRSSTGRLTTSSQSDSTSDDLCRLELISGSPAGGALVRRRSTDETIGI